MSLLNYSKQPRTLLFGFLSIAGISFWFLLGFPFANHNESYLWVVSFNRVGFLDVLWKPLGLVANVRPLAMVTAWLGYRLSGGSIYPQQVLNYLGAALAWLLLFSAIKEKKLFSWVSLLVGGGLFSGYIYLFHLHGVFYSPLLMFMAFLLAISISDGRLRTSWLVSASALAAIVSLYHPFAIIVYIAFVLGYFLENLRFVTRKQLVMTFLFLVTSFGLVKMLVPNEGLHLKTNAMVGLLTSYRMVEVNLAVSVVSWLLSVATGITLSTSLRIRAAVGGVVTVLSFVFVWLSLPVLIIWIAVCLLKSVLIERWTIVFLILAAAILPAASPTGSPVYAVFVLMVCSCVATLGYFSLERDSILHDSVAVAALILVISASALLKAGVHLPIMSRLANPLLAEKEKTFQMEDIVRWMLTSDFKEYRLVLSQAWGGPAASTNAINRAHRPPTGQHYLDAYVGALRKHEADSSTGPLWVSFGGEKVEGAEEVYAVPGKYNGEASVWKRDR